ncbi:MULTISPECIES: hypothetical protein [unclassified Caballeronia]|uniref:hypothetical protein n=1 Tax=unclassified Caballeronia TaxID=2646786 RepID=UPI002028E444|nr:MULTISPECIES: hypothetical protein [unclassified Caballeronia]
MTTARPIRTSIVPTLVEGFTISYWTDGVEVLVPDALSTTVTGTSGKLLGADTGAAT